MASKLAFFQVAPPQHESICSTPRSVHEDSFVPLVPDPALNEWDFTIRYAQFFDGVGDVAGGTNVCDKPRD